MPADASAGWTNSFFVCCFWALLSAWWRGVEMRQWATAHLPVRLMLEGFLCELLFAVVFLLFAYLSAGGARRSLLAQGAGAVLLLFGPIYWVRFSGGRAWPFLTRLALCMQAAVVALKFNSLVATRRALEAAAAPAAEAPEPAPAAREGGEIGGRAWARAPPAQPGAARGAWGIVRFLFSPALVYEPRPALFLTFSLSVFAEKLALIAALAVLAVFLHERTLADVWARAGERDVVTSFFEAVLPLHALSILLFFSTFVGVVGASAELTGYADRFAYSEWWSSTTFSEFARRWNKPVGDWLRAVSAIKGQPRYTWRDFASALKINTPPPSPFLHTPTPFCRASTMPRARVCAGLCASMRFQ